MAFHISSGKIAVASATYSGYHPFQVREPGASSFLGFISELDLEEAGSSCTALDLYGFWENLDVS